MKTLSLDPGLSQSFSYPGSRFTYEAGDYEIEVKLSSGGNTRVFRLPAGKGVDFGEQFDSIEIKNIGTAAQVVDFAVEDKEVFDNRKEVSPVGGSFPVEPVAGSMPTQVVRRQRFMARIYGYESPGEFNYWAVSAGLRGINGKKVCVDRVGIVVSSAGIPNCRYVVGLDENDEIYGQVGFEGVRRRWRELTTKEADVAHTGERGFTATDDEITLGRESGGGINENILVSGIAEPSLDRIFLNVEIPGGVQLEDYTIGEMLKVSVFAGSGNIDATGGQLSCEAYFYGYIYE
jgi:hypothetical protein